MRAKLYFANARAAEVKLRSLQARLHRYEDLGMVTGPGLSPTGGGSHGYSGSRVEAAAIGIVDTTAEIREEIARLMEIHNEAQHIIDQVPQEKYRLLLTYHYLAGMKLAEVGRRIYENENSVYRAKGWALYEAQKIIDKEIVHG